MLVLWTRESEETVATHCPMCKRQTALFNPLDFKEYFNWLVQTKATEVDQMCDECNPVGHEEVPACLLSDEGDDNWHLVIDNDYIWICPGQDKVVHKWLGSSRLGWAINRIRDLDREPDWAVKEFLPTSDVPF